MLFENDKKSAEQYPYMNMYTNYMKRMTRPLVGRQHEMEQVMAAMMKPEYCNVLLLGEAGSGKALADDTPIPVADLRVYAPIGGLAAGDVVYSRDGEPVRVLGVFPQGRKHAFAVSFADGSEIVCNDEHIWAARTDKQRRKGKPYAAHTLADMMKQGMKDKNGKPKWYIPDNGPVERKEIELGLDPYVLGAFLAGSGCTGGAAALTAPGECADEVAKRLGMNVVTDFDGWVFRSGGDGPCVTFADLAGEAYDVSCRELPRRIPEWYFNASIGQRTELLQGMMDAAGECKNGICTLVCDDAELLCDAQDLAASLGYRCRKDEKGLVLTATPERIAKLFLRRDVSNVKFKRGRVADGLAITGVKDLEREVSMTCIYVDGGQHLFQAGKRHLVTHNTALVQGIMVKDTDRTYLEVDLSKMIANLKNENEMADRLKSLFNEVSLFRKERNREIVLFIDEFHQIVQLSAAAVEVLKPLLADSGTRGIRVIAATTHIEYQQFIAPNLPLVERLQRIKLVQPGEEVVVSILQSMCDRYKVEPAHPSLFSDIYTYTNRYIPSTSQPRKSILILDSMIGWHRLTHRPLDRRLLADVIYETEGINVAFRVDAANIKKKLDEKVLAQQVATSSIEQRLQICVAGLNNPNRPMSSFLFTGSTGVGKSIANSTEIPVPDERHFVHIDELVPGDLIFGTDGKPVKVLGVYPQGLRHAYKVTMRDGTSIICNDEHLWSVRDRGSHDQHGDYKTVRLADILNEGFVKNDQRKKWYITVPEAVERPEIPFKLDPYVVGALIGDGCVSKKNMVVELGSADEFVVHKVADLIGAIGVDQHGYGCNWSFKLPVPKTDEDDGLTRPRRDRLYFYPKDLIDEYCEDGVFGCRSYEKHIPEAYMYGSLEQRWALLHGLMDTDGCLYTSSESGKSLSCTYVTTSERLAGQVASLINSLGIRVHTSKSLSYPVGRMRYEIRVIGDTELKRSLFTLPRKRDVPVDPGGERFLHTDDLKILDIEDLGCEMPMTCIEVDSDDHQFLATDRYLPVHNTETTKQLAAILYDDDRNLIRFDMTEYANADSLNRFRRELTNRVSTIPYCIVLLDEIEKACAPVTRLLLQVLDDGRLMDENEREVTFKNAYIVITTNAGNEIYKTISNYEQSDKADFKTLEKYDKLIRESIKSQSGSKFPPELLGRIDCIVPFQPLSRKTMMGIVQQKLRALTDLVYRKHGVKLHVHRNIYVYLIYDKLDTDSDSGGARVVVAKLEREVTVPLSRYINEHPGEKEVFVSVGGEMAILNKRQLESEAYIYVGPKFVNTGIDLAERMSGQA